MGIVTNHENKKTRGKLADRGKPCSFMGYAENHAPDDHKMLNLRTNKVVISRDVRWMKRSYGDYKDQSAIQVTVKKSESDDDDDWDESDDDAYMADAVDGYTT